MLRLRQGYSPYIAHVETNQGRQRSPTHTMPKRKLKSFMFFSDDIPSSWSNHISLFCCVKLIRKTLSNKILDIFQAQASCVMPLSVRGSEGDGEGCQKNEVSTANATLACKLCVVNVPRLQPLQTRFGCRRRCCCCCMCRLIFIFKTLNVAVSTAASRSQSPSPVPQHSSSESPLSTRASG